MTAGETHLIWHSFRTDSFPMPNTAEDAAHEQRMAAPKDWGGVNRCSRYALVRDTGCCFLTVEMAGQMRNNGP